MISINSVLITRIIDQHSLSGEYLEIMKMKQKKLAAIKLYVINKHERAVFLPF